MLATVFGIGIGLLAPSLDPAPGPAIRYTVQGGELVDELARWYGVDAAALRSENPGSMKRGRVLEIDARTLPPPRQRLAITTPSRATWSTIAARYDVSENDLKTWNPRAARRRRPREGTRLVLWLPSSVLRYPLPDDDAGFPQVARPLHGTSVGKPNRGRLLDGARLPEGPYTIRFDWQSFGSALTVWNVARVLRAFREETGFEPDLFVGALSRRTGRRLPPHRSHQSGRDVDIRLPAMPHARGYKLQVDEVDWHATWALIDAFVRTDDVLVIFLERKLRERLRRAGMAMGADDARLERVMTVVRHSPGHTAHIHVRFICDPGELECRSA